MQAFLAEQKAFQAAAIQRLSGEPAFAPFVTAANLAFAKAFIVALDTFSLYLCWGVDRAIEIFDVPVAVTGGGVTLTLRPGGDDVRVDPWPFQARSVVVLLEGARFTFHGERLPWSGRTILRPAIRTGAASAL